MRAPSQRSALGALFVVLGLGFAGIAAASFAHNLVIAIAAVVLALWLWSLSARVLRRH